MWGDALKSGEVQVIVQTGINRDPALPNVPLARELVTNNEARQLMKVGIELPAQILRVFILPPGTPKDRMEMLRQAFMQTFKDPEFLEDAKKVKMEVSPTSGADVEKVVAEFHAVPSGVKQKLKEVLSAK